MKRIYLVRHGETYANKLQVYPSKEEQINETGQAQAIALAKRIAGLDVSAIYISDFIRTAQTAEPVVEVKKLEPIVLPDLGEVREPSSFVGVKENTEAFLQFKKDRYENFHDLDWTYEDAENIHAILERAKRMRSFFETMQEEQVLVVSHAMFLRYFLAAILLGAAEPSVELISIVRNLKITNVGISLVTFDEGAWKVVMINDHAHFAE